MTNRYNAIPVLFSIRIRQCFHRKLFLSSNRIFTIKWTLISINLRYTYGGQIDPQGYEFIYNFVKYGDKQWRIQGGATGGHGPPKNKFLDPPVNSEGSHSVRLLMQFSNFHIFPLFPNCNFAGYITARNKRFANKLMWIFACRNRFEKFAIQ